MIGLRRQAEYRHNLQDAGNLAVKLLRTYVAQLEAFQRYRGKGQQNVTVEHVHVHQGGQAIVGHVETTRGWGHRRKWRNHPMQNGLPMHLSPRCLARTRSGKPLPVADGEG
jgi:hypothetical protein